MRSKRRSLRRQKAEVSAIHPESVDNEWKTWHNYPHSIAYVQLPLPTPALGNQHRTHDTVAPVGPESDLIESTYEEARSQSTLPSQASLLGLPAELRIRIYEHIWPEDLIHISARPCKANTKGAWETDTNKSSWDNKPHYVRWTHTVCQVPNDWERAYTLSKASDSTSEPVTRHGPREPTASSEPTNRHEKCELIQESFRRQRYITTRRNDGNWSAFQKEFVSSMTKRHGPASKGGLENLHASSKLHLSLLYTCRQIYSEARVLPYIRSLWQFHDPSTLATFASQVSAPVKAVRISNWSWTDIASALKALPQVSNLQYSCNYSSGHCGRMALASEMLDFLRYMPREERVKLGLKEVEVILGEDMGEQGRGVRREIAAEMERLMMGG